ncbi:MAG: response regulator [Alphaproteobacteria bacterium]|jgi:CheY-like chemotaxis protein
MSRILVIDDDELFIKLMVHALTQRGHEVDFALDGLEGSKKFAATTYDAVVCDIVMPEQEGVKTITSMRRARPDVGIVAISGGLTKFGGKSIDILEIAERLGADRTLNKPFQLSELAKVVDEAIAARRPEAPRAASV